MRLFCEAMCAKTDSNVVDYVSHNALCGGSLLSEKPHGFLGNVVFSLHTYRRLVRCCGVGRKMASVVPKKSGVVLKHVKSIVVKFCPFEKNVESTREFLQCVYSKKAYASNVNCDVKTDIQHDGSEPVVDVVFADGRKLIMKGANLTVKDMLKAFSSRCEELASQEKDQKKEKQKPRK
uniref:Large ribosomal subunit protein mL53 n=1 Tax=Salvator merianae TaxID=96440 RepID=A0A8D0DQ24_SALMN